MSNKTLKQRIAVVAASALTAGFLSVAAMPTANAAAGDITVTAVTGQVTAPSITASVGTGVITSTGTVQFAVAAVGASVATQVRISGGTFVSVVSGADVDAGGTVATNNLITATAIVGLIAKPTGAGRDMVVKVYAANMPTAAVNKATLDAVTAQTNTWTITVIAAGTNGVFSSGLSAIAIVNSASTSSSATNADTSSANIIAAGGSGVISYDLKDANNLALPSSAIVYASIKSGPCVIGLNTAPTSGTMVVGVSPADLIYVAQADSTNTPAATCAVDITVDGVLGATKNFTFQGPVASIEVTSIAIGATSTTNTGVGNVVAKDSAGTLIGNVVVSAVLTDSSKAGIVSAATAGTTARISAALNGGTGVSSTTVPTTVGWTCTSTAGTAPVVFRTPNGVGGFITSPTYNVVCAGNAVNYTAGLDKASYLPGDIATLTITGKGSRGEVANDGYVFASGSAGEVMSLSGSQLTLVGTTASETFTSGSKSYKFVVGTTEGSFNMVVELPKILSATNKVLYGAAVQTVAYKVAASTTAVSNADVLKSIVSLIASINKQIQALQKLILARR